jgi:hypothetical protein
MTETKRKRTGQRRLARPRGSAPDILEEGETWCDNCQKIGHQIGPWQDICECGAFVSRSGYDDEEITKREAQNASDEP